MNNKNKKRKWFRPELWKLIKSQREDMNNKDYVDNDFDPKSTDIYHRRPKSRGPGFRRQ